MYNRLIYTVWSAGPSCGLYLENFPLSLCLYSYSGCSEHASRYVLPLGGFTFSPMHSSPSTSINTRTKYLCNHSLYCIYCHHY